MLTIAHLTAPAAFGGLERVVAGLARVSVARGHRVVLVLTLEVGGTVPGWAEALSGAGVILEPVFLPPRAYRSERRAVRALLSRHAVDVVHTHGYRSDVVHAGTAKGAGLPLVSTAHGFATTRGIGLLYEWLQRRAWRTFDAVVVVSKPLLEVLARAGVPRDRLVFIRNGLDGNTAPRSRDDARARLGLPQAGAVVGWVGRFSEEKDPGAAIEALALSRDRDLRLCMIGAGPLLDACRALTHERGVADRVTFAGAVADAGQLLRAFDALMLTSRTEGTPMVILEAAAAGVPVVATSVGGVPDLLEEDGGWLAPAGRADGIAAAVADLMADAAEARRRADRLQARLMAGPEDWVERYLDLYARVIGR